MTFSVANNNALLETTILKWAVESIGTGLLGNIDLPVNISTTSQNSDNLYIKYWDII